MHDAQQIKRKRNEILECGVFELMRTLGHSVTNKNNFEHCQEILGGALATVPRVDDGQIDGEDATKCRGETRVSHGTKKNQK